ncbi:MAG: hypothetical protein ACRDXE_02030 [Acidimicrobiales bacterium]
MGPARTDTAFSRVERSQGAAQVLVSSPGTVLTGYADALARLPGVVGSTLVIENLGPILPGRPGPWAARPRCAL